MNNTITVEIDYDRLRQIIREENVRLRQIEQDEELLTCRQVMKFLNVTKQTVYNYADRGTLIQHRIEGKVFYKRGEIKIKKYEHATI